MSGFLVVVVAAVVALLTLMYVFQRSLIYMPLGGVPPVEEMLPGAEAVTFETADGLTLGAWFLPADRPGSPATLLFNGNAGNRALRAPLAERFHRLGMSVLMVDYRGYGGNPGSPSEKGLLADARAALGWLVRRPEVDPAKVLYFGESLGSGVAVALAAERPPAALVMRSPFTSLVDAAKAHFPLLPVGLLMRDRFPSVERIGAIHCPVAIVAGDPDSVVPTDLSRRLFEAAREPKRLLIYRGFDHNDAELSHGDLWVGEVAGFLRRTGVLQ